VETVAPTPNIRPWLFVPVLYFMQAVPVTVVQEVSTIFYKDLGVPNAAIAQWTSLIALPWSLQFLLGPLVDLNGPKRAWILKGQFLIALGLGLAALLLQVPHAFELTLLLLGSTAMVSALCNIATDGFYILTLDRTRQAAFVGVQTTFYRLGRLFCAGLLVYALGLLTSLPRIDVQCPPGSYLRFLDGRKQIVLTEAKLGVNNSAGGELTDEKGRILQPIIRLPHGTTSWSLESDGTVLAGSSAVGRLEILHRGGGPLPTVQSGKGSAWLAIELGWTLVLLLGTGIYFGGHVWARRAVPDTAEDVPASGDAGELGRNVRRTVAVVALGLSGYFVLNALVRLGAHGLWLLLGGDPLGPWKGWMLPASNRILGMDFQLGGAGTEVLQLAICLPIALAALAYARKSIKGTPMGDAFSSFVRQSGFWAIFGFILFYRFGEAMVTKMSPLFLKDAVEVGGLAVPNERLGLIKGVAGVAGIILGGISGGYFASRLGLRRAFLPMAVLMHLPNLLYLWAALAHPASTSPLLFGIDFLDQFGYGFGFAGYSVYLMWVAQRGQFKTSHYAIGTGMGALCIAVAGILSGVLFANFGYVGVFISAMVFTVPGTLMLFLIPYEDSLART